MILPTKRKPDREESEAENKKFLLTRSFILSRCRNTLTLKYHPILSRSEVVNHCTFRRSPQSEQGLTTKVDEVRHIR